MTPTTRFRCPIDVRWRRPVSSWGRSIATNVSLVFEAVAELSDRKCSRGLVHTRRRGKSPLLRRGWNATRCGKLAPCICSPPTTQRGQVLHQRKKFSALTAAGDCNSSQLAFVSSSKGAIFHDVTIELRDRGVLLGSSVDHICPASITTGNIHSWTLLRAGIPTRQICGDAEAVPSS